MMKKPLYLLPIALIGALVIFSFLRRDAYVRAPFERSQLAMDTFVEITVYDHDSTSIERAVNQAFSAIEKIDTLFGDCMIDANGEQEVTKRPEFKEILTISSWSYRATRGLFDPTLGCILRLWDFHPGAEPPADDSIEIALRNVGLARFLDGQRRGVILDLGGIAKGYAVDLAAEILKSHGVTSAIINAGGDLRIIGRKPDGSAWRIAVRHPRKEGFIGLLELEDVAVATSGDYEKYFMWNGKRYHHILDPRSGMPAEGCVSVTVIASKAAVADALATGLFVLGPYEGKVLAEELDQVEAIFIWADGDSLCITSGLTGSFRRVEDQGTD